MVILFHNTYTFFCFLIQAIQWNHSLITKQVFTLLAVTEWEAWSMHVVHTASLSASERRVFWFVLVKKNKNKFVTVDVSSVKVWGCRITARKWSFPNWVKSTTQIFDNLYGREPLQVIKDSPKVRRLYRQQGGITDSCLQWLNVFLLVYGQGQKSTCRKDF